MFLVRMEGFVDELLGSFKQVFSHIFSKKLKIGIICHPFMGGSGISATSIAAGLAKRGHEVHLIVYKRPFKVDKKLVKVHLIPVKQESVFDYFPITLVTASKIEEVIRKEKLDIINVHYALPYSVSSYLAKQIALTKGVKIPIVTTLHGTDIHTIGKKKDFRSVIKFTLENSDGIIAVSRYLADQAKEIEVHSEVKVIPNYIDVDKFKPDNSSEIKKLRKQFAKEKEKVILHVSNFRKVKRIEDIIRSFNLIKRKTKSNLVLVGAGPELKKMKELVTRLKLNKRVFFAGKQKKIEKYYAMADLFLLSSDKEGFPLSILEAMASGVPVVSAKSGGVPELVVHGKTGYLVEKQDIRGMANRSIKILTSSKLRNEMKIASREEVVEKYTKDKIISQYEDYFMKMSLKATKI